MVLLGRDSGACGYRGRQRFSLHDAPPAKEKLTLGAEKSLVTAAIWIAEAQGLFAREGLDVTLREFDSGRASLLAMLAGEVDVSTAAPTPIMFESFQRDDFVIFSGLTYSDNDIKIIARADKGIQSAQDLAGKRIGITQGTTGQFFLDTYVTLNDVRASALSEVALMPSQLPVALESGIVDAIVTWEPHAGRALQSLGANGLRLPADSVYRTTFNLLAMRAFATTQPQVLEKLLRALHQATTLIHEQGEMAQNIVANRLKLHTAEVAASWREIVFALSLSNGLLLNLESEARWAVNTALVKAGRIPDYNTFIYQEPLRNVMPQAVYLAQ